MDPILTALVQSNEPLSESQALHVQQILGDTHTALWDVEKEISTVLLSLLKLEKERRLRSEYAATLKGVLSPIRRIPSEILAEIFLLCRDDSLGAPKYSITDRRHAPMLLGHVSSRWRQVSHSSPRLWDHVHIQWNYGSRNPPEALLRWILASSRILPLHVKVKLKMTGPDLPTGLADENVLDLLFRQHQRLKDVHLDLTPWISHPTFSTNGPSPSSPQLKLLLADTSISLTSCPYSRTHRRFTFFIEDEPNLEMFFDAFSFPKLHYLNIGAESWAPHILPNLFARSNFILTHLELHRINFAAEDLIQFLRNFPGLRVLDLSYCCINDALFRALTYSDPIPPFALPQLESFTITEETQNQDGALIAEMVESGCAHSGG
ncbi:hypothetical protein FB451DRAFT_1466648 [Mycena latifolia]|nr:hypothetical protein FB451DRAFT_1466648 [Mycena latifolia]